MQVIPAGRSVIETCGLLLGYRPDLAVQLAGLNGAARISIKGRDNASFEHTSGAKQEFFQYSLMALKTFLGTGVNVWPAVTGNLFGTERTRCITAFIKELVCQYPY